MSGKRWEGSLVEILTAVCMREVVAPPIMRGTESPWRVISFATYTISSSDGVISPADGAVAGRST